MPAAGRRKPVRVRMNKKLRNEFAMFYTDPDQEPHTNFWPDVGLISRKKNTAMKPLPPVGMSLINVNHPLRDWVDPPHGLALPDWVSRACHLNGRLMLFEFKQENAIRSAMKDNPEMDIMLHEGGDVLPVKASVFFGRDVIRFGSWSFYCKLLVYMRDHGYTLDAIDGAIDWSRRSHISLFMSSYMPLSYLKSLPMNTIEDKDNIAKAIVACMRMFVDVRSALFGVDADGGLSPHDRFIGQMIINTDNNAVSRLQEVLRLSDAVRFVCALPHTPAVQNVFNESWNDELTPRVLLSLLRMKDIVPPLKEFDTFKRQHDKEQPLARNLDIVNINRDAFVKAVKPLVEYVFGDDEWHDPQIQPVNIDDIVNDGASWRLSNALCLLQLAYGGRYVDTLLFNKIMPVGDYLASLGVSRDDYSVFPDSVAAVLHSHESEYGQLAVTNIIKQHNEFSGRCLLSDLFDPHFLGIQKDGVPPPEVVFFRLLSAVRRALFETFRRFDVDWDSYKVNVHGHVIPILYVPFNDEDTIAVRTMKSRLYGSVSDAASFIFLDGINKIGTHDLRRLYCAYSYYRYAKREHMDKTAFVHSSLGHKSGSATFNYMTLSIVD